jgi:hypothetical protein
MTYTGSCRDWPIGAYISSDKSLIIYIRDGKCPLYFDSNNLQFHREQDYWHVTSQNYTALEENLCVKVRSENCEIF